MWKSKQPGSKLTPLDTSFRSIGDSSGGCEPRIVMILSPLPSQFGCHLVPANHLLEIKDLRPAAAIIAHGLIHSSGWEPIQDFDNGLLE
jgi:hypothetical protein